MKITGNSTFAIVNQSTYELLQNEQEAQKVHKTKIKSHQSTLKDKREQRIKDLEERLRQTAGNHKGCMKALKIVSIVITAISAVASAGSALPALSGTLAAMQTASNTIFAFSSALTKLTDGLTQLLDANNTKKYLLSQAQAQEVLLIIEQTEKWIEEEKQQLEISQKVEQDILDEHLEKIIELERSYQAIITQPK